jgi:hypothetical protein
MFLEAIGAGNAGIFFLNQPIVEKYLEYLDGIGSKSFMNKTNLEYIRNMFPATEQDVRNASISVEGLYGNITQYRDKKGRLDSRDNAEQQLILNEFIKYTILGSQLFSYTQATNYDTTKFGSSDLYLKKQLGTLTAENFNLISNVNDVLNNTFVGKMSELLGKSFNSFGAIMKTEDPKIKAYMIDTLKEYAKRKYMTADDYLKVANLINNSFLDYIIQNDRNFYNLIKPDLVDSETAVVTKLEQAKQKYPSIQILKDLAPAIGNREGGAQSIELKANVKSAYSENLYVGMMRELRDANPELNSLYNDIINVAILQGVGQTAISIRNIIPLEDYAAKITPIINNLQPNINLESYSNGMFQRNNFNNKDVFTEFSPYFMESNETIIDSNTGEEELAYFIPTFKEMRGVTRKSRRLITLNDVYNSFQLSSDYIKIPKVITNKDGLKVNVATGLEVTKKDYTIMKQKGSQDLYDGYYYKKVYTDNMDQFGNRIPLKTYNKKIDGYDYYYKLINVYGDGPRAVEYNSEFGRSVINNGSVQLDKELDDRDIVNFFAPQVEEKVVPLEEPTMVMQPDNVQKILSGEKTTTLRVDNFPSGVYNFGGKDFQVTNRGLLNVEEAGGVEAISKSEAFAETGPKYSTTKDFLAGKRKLYVYDITPVGSVAEEETLTEPLEQEIARLKKEIEEAKFNQGQLSDTMPEMIVVNNWSKITPESAQKETGLKGGTKADISPSLLNKSGVTVDQAANDIWESEFGIDSNVDTQDVKNIIIDILYFGNISKYKESIVTNSEIENLKSELRDKQEELNAQKEKVKSDKKALKASQLGLFGNTLKLKDGNEYTSDQLNTKMLLDMGYTTQEAGKIIKNNKC